MVIAPSYCATIIMNRAQSLVPRSQLRGCGWLLNSQLGDGSLWMALLTCRGGRLQMVRVAARPEATAQRCAAPPAVLGTALILQPGCGARIVPEDSSQLAQAVVDLLNDPAQEARRGASARAAARGRASKLMAARMQEFYARQCPRAKIVPGSAAPTASGNSHERQACLDRR